MLEFFNLFRSNFGPHHEYPLPKPPEPWHRVFRRLPQLRDDEKRSHIDVVLPREVVPFDTGVLRNFELPQSVLIGFLGPPKSAKTLTLKRIDSMLQQRHILHIMHPEPKRLMLPLMNDRATLNEIRLQRCAERIMKYEAWVTSGGEAKQHRNMYFDENGVLHALLFAYAQELWTGRPARLKSIMQTAKRHLHAYDIAVMMHVPEYISTLRGTKMDRDQLDAFHEAMDWLPRRIADLKTPANRPLTIIWESYTGKTKQETARHVLSSIGTALRGYQV